MEINWRDRSKMDETKKVDAYIKFGEMADLYGRVYHEQDFSETYPSNRYRLDIFIPLVMRINPDKVLDVGCGTGDPLVEFLNLGLNAVGFDYSEEMVSKARENLKKNGYPEDLVHRNGYTLNAVSNIATMLSGGVPAWMACDGPRM